MNSSSSTGSRRSWDPIQYIGAPLIPSPAANRTGVSLRRRDGTAGLNSTKPFKGYGKLMRKRPTTTATQPPKPTSPPNRAPSSVSSLSSRVFHISLSDDDSEVENHPPSPVESFEARLRRKIAEEKRSKEARTSGESEMTFDSHPKQTERRHLAGISSSYHSCCSALGPLESTRLPQAANGNFDASSVSAIGESEVPFNVSMSSDSTLNQSPAGEPARTTRYCEIFPIAEGLSPKFSPVVNKKSVAKKQPAAKTVIPETESEDSSDVVQGSPVSAPPSVAKTLEKLRSVRKYRKSIVIPETSDEESEEEEEMQPKKLFEPELIVLDSEDEDEQNSVQAVPSTSRVLGGVESVKKDAGSNRVNRWVLENSKNFRRTSSSSTLATFREFVENDDDTRTTMASELSKEKASDEKRKKKKSPRRKSMQCGERDSPESEAPTTVYDSTDDEEADRRLRELFEKTRREKAETEKKRRSGRKDEGLDAFVVPDVVCSSSEEDVEEIEEKGSESNPLEISNVFRDSIPEDAFLFAKEWRKPLEPLPSPPRCRTPAPRRRPPKAATTVKQPKSAVRLPRVPASEAKANMKAEIAAASLEEIRDAKAFLGALDESSDCWGNTALELADKCKMFFKVVREELTRLLYATFNKHCFDERLPKDMEITWNARMVKTAGFCVYKLQRFHPGPDGTSKPSVRFARIELSEKVLDSADRLRDTLVHEMCHAMSWIVSECNGGHGPVWKRWTKRVAIVFPNIPSITTKHTYEIKTKYTYRCVECGYSLGRHSKSLDTERKRCGYCYGRFELIVNGRPKAPSEVARSARKVAASPASVPSARKLNKFAQFVQENFKTLKETEGAGKSHGELMGMLSRRFAALKMLQEDK